MTDDEPRLTRYGNYKLSKAQAAAMARLYRSARERLAREAEEDQAAANDQDVELWNTSEVARYLGLKVGTVSAYRHRGQMPLPVRTIGKRTHLWDAATIRAWRAPSMKQEGS